MMTALSALITAMFQCRTTWAMNFYEHSHHWWRALMRFLILGMTYCLVASSMTAFLAPRAAGSGLPEIKGFLNGSKIKGLWQLRVFVVKFFAIALAIGAGLPVGREGPAVFLGASLAHALWRHGHRIWHGGLLWHGHQARDAEHKRLYATIGGAAGIASAFGAPIGGVLYVFEEISSYWDERKTVLACVEI